MFHRDYDIYIVSHSSSGSHKDPDFSLTGILTGILAVIIAIAVVFGIYLLGSYGLYLYLQHKQKQIYQNLYEWETEVMEDPINVKPFFELPGSKID